MDTIKGLTLIATFLATPSYAAAARVLDERPIADLMIVTAADRRP
jgi:hypothetical protein